MKIYELFFILTSYPYFNALIDFVLMEVEVLDEGVIITTSSSRNGPVNRQFEYPGVDIGAPDLVSNQVKLSLVCSYLVVFHTYLYRYFFTCTVSDVICKLFVYK
jgi:hypothetical protein